MTAVCEENIVASYTLHRVDPRDTLAVLQAARDWLRDPRHWTRGVYWINALGRPTMRHELVAATCAVGALSYVTGLDDDLPREAADALARVSGEDGPVRVNDRDGYEAVMAMYDEAIACMEGSRGA